MKWFLTTLAAVLCMTNVSYGDVTLGYVQNPDPAPGYASYTIQVTGVGINCLGAFEISGNIHQVWTAPNTQSEWINHSNGNTPGDPMDSHVLFGEDRIPDLPNMFVGGTGVPAATFETIHNGTTVGLGTLDNSRETADAYVIFGAPGTYEQTHDLLQLVAPIGEFVTVEVDIYSFNGDSGVPELIPLGLFFGDDALMFLAESANPIPEPSTLVLIAIGLVSLFFARLRGR